MTVSTRKYSSRWRGTRGTVNKMAVRLGDICNKIGSGLTPTGGSSVYVDSGVALVRSQNVLNMAFSTDGLAFINESVARAMDNVSLYENDILLNITGDSVARMCLVPKEVLPARVNQHVCIIRVDDKKANPQFVYYQLYGIQKTLLSLASVGATRKALTKQMIEDLEIELPLRQLQDTIVSIISNIQSKIDINKAINDNLEQQALARYHSIFDNIEPTVPMDSLHFSIESGKRPNGGIDPDCKEVPSIGAENVKSLGLYDYSKTKFVTQDYFQNMKKGKSDDNKIRLYIYKDGGTPGNYIPHFSLFGKGFPFDQFSINEHVFQIDYGDEKINSFAYYFFNTDEIRYELEVRGGKAAIPGIGQSAITDLKIYDFDSTEVKVFSDYAYDVTRMILANCVEIRKLAEIRDYLLPKLMSGEIDVSTLEIPN